jgi:hypothetical protein
MSWLISQTLMNSLCLQEQVGEYLGANSLDGEQSVQSNGKPIQQAYCAPDKMTDFSRLSRFGMTFKPLTESRGEELLTLYLAGFHAKTLVPLEKAQELMESDQGCGEKWLASFVKFDPDTHSWRTHQCSLLGGLELFSETWPQWGLMRDGECWEQRTLEQTIRGTESGSLEKLPTPTASDYKDQPTSKSWKSKGVINYKLSNPEIRAKWPTPDANCGSRGTQPDWKPVRKSGQPAQYTINQEVRDRMFPTPQASDHRDRGNLSNPSIQKRAEKGKQLNLSMVVHPTSGKLNADWVEWLMNWPIKWSEINGFKKKEFERWTQTSATPLQSFRQVRTMWWDSDPSQTPFRPQPNEQSEEQCSDTLSNMSWDASCKREMEGSHERTDLSLLRKNFYIQQSEGENLQSEMREQTCVDETQIVPRVGGSSIATVDRLKAIGNGQVPLCAATAFRILSQDL